MARPFMPQAALKNKSTAGFITLFATVLLGALALGLCLALFAANFWQARSSGDALGSARARQLANSCAEAALQNLHDNTAFTGGGSLVLGVGTCFYDMSGSGGGRTITVIANVSLIVKKLHITVDAVSPKIHIASWQEAP